MPNYIQLSNGLMNIDEGDQKAAIYFLDDMIWDIKNAQKYGGFESRAVVGMMWKWLKVSQLLREPNYVRYNFISFIRDAPAPPAGKKSSAMLLLALQRLSSYPVTSAADLHYILWKEAEKAMITFISDYRKVLKVQDKEKLAYFTSYLMRLAQLGTV